MNGVNGHFDKIVADLEVRAWEKRGDVKRAAPGVTPSQKAAIHDAADESIACALAVSKLRPVTLHPNGSEPMTPEQRMTALCLTVPMLAHRAGFGLGWDTDQVFPGDPDGLSEEYDWPDWTYGGASAEAVRFVRHVWSASNRAPSMVHWDTAHVRAFAAWAARPWWC